MVGKTKKVVLNDAENQGNRNFFEKNLLTDAKTDFFVVMFKL